MIANINKIWLTFAVLLLCGTVLRAQKTKGPRLEIMDARHDFGTLYEGAIVNHMFTITNQGDQPLIITDITQSCGCVQSVFPRMPLAPADTAFITIRFVTTGKIGKQDRRMRIVSNATSGPREMRIQALVEPQSKRPKQD